MSEEWTVVRDVGLDLGFCEDGPSLRCECGGRVDVDIDSEPGTCNACGRRYTVETVVKVAPALPDWKPKEYPAQVPLTSVHMSEILAYLTTADFVFPEFCQGEGGTYHA